MWLGRYDGAGNLEVMDRVGGSWTVVGKVAFPVTSLQFYWLRFDLQASVASIKGWADGTQEPPAWTGTWSSAAIGIAGETGLYGYATTRVRFDSFSVSAMATGPTAALTVTPASGAAPLNVVADASGSTAGSNPISSYTFDFGDGTVVGPQTGATASHTFAGGGYTVSVTVADSVGASSSATSSVNSSSSIVVQDTFHRPNQSGWGTDVGILL